MTARAFHDPDFSEAYVDGLPPRAVLLVAPPPWIEDGRGISVHAADAEAAAAVCEGVPSGRVLFHLTDEWLLGFLEARALELDAHPAWLFALDPKDFVDGQRHEVRPLTTEWSSLVAKAWESESDEEPYVRSRIEAGPSAAVYLDGAPMAWGMTHFETDGLSEMGFLHVLEAHRRKGYARSVGSALVKDILARGKVPILHVYADNVPSLELTVSLGFHKVKRQVWGEAVLR